MDELDKTRTSSDDIGERLDTSKTTGKRIRINYSDVETLKKIPGIGEKRANLIVHLREANGNITQKSLELLIEKGLPEEELETIDFAPNDQKFTDKQQKRIGKDDTTPGHTEEAGKKVRINYADVETLKKIPGIGEKRANLIVHFREATGNTTQESLELLIGKGLPEEELETIDFAPNDQKFTDKQQKLIDKDDTTLGCTDEDVWDNYLKKDDFKSIWKLLKNKKLPTYNTFLMLVDKLSTQTDDLRDFCGSVSNNLKARIPGAKIVYPAINPNNNRTTFVILSTCPSDENYVDGYPVETKYAYGQCNEDYSISDKEMNEDLCFKSKEDEDNLNAAVNKAHERFSEWPNYSCISFSFYKSRKYNEDDHNTALIEKGCIVLFVYLKHWKPVGWDFFPGDSHGYEIDVRESTCARLHTRTLYLDNTLSLGGTMQGTLRKEGVNDKVFSLTAAQCVFDSDSFKIAMALKKRNGLAVLEDGKLPLVFKRRPHLLEGSTTKMVYGGTPFVDAALVEFDGKLHKKAFNQRLFNDDFNLVWKDYGIERQPSLRDCFQLGTFARNDVVIKCGMTTKVTVGKVRSPEGYFMGGKGHIHIQSLKSSKSEKTKPFSAPGDSGSFVFVVNKEILTGHLKGTSNHQKGDLALIGMVRGSIEGNGFYSTKMAATMTALGNEYTFEEEEEEQEQEQQEEQQEEQES
ncbi:uncharacterized protein LOC128221228 isoform X2 [Mya arenaria]|uniref:uncharacterized protein LOC128221228 isoform X2 n=1 Tax=Mya arenaria TaxID=6604 RepID=UPI0022E353B9|nr:uncharacterized protein LOC128221228 isoform X2 [Mya arenaria]